VEEDEQKRKDRIEQETRKQWEHLAKQKRTTVAKSNMKIEIRTSGDTKTEEEYAQEKKDEANKLFAQSRIKEARTKYSEALSYFSSERPGLYVTLLSNRAMCHLKLDEPRECIKDTEIALRLDPSQVKARFRQAMAHSKLRMWKKAKEDFEAVVELDPTDTKSVSELRSVTRKLKEEQDARRAHARNLICADRPFTMPMRRLKIHEIDSSGKIVVPVRTERDEVEKKGKSLPQPTPLKLITKQKIENPDKTPYIPKCLRPMGGDDSEPETKSTSSTTPIPKKENKPAFKPALRSKSNRPVKNFYDFEARWRGLRYPKKRWEFIQDIDIAKLCRESFSTELLLEMMETCDGEDPKKVQQILQNLPTVRRWDIVHSGLTSAEKIQLNTMMQGESIGTTPSSPSKKSEIDDNEAPPSSSTTEMPKNTSTSSQNKKQSNNVVSPKNKVKSPTARSSKTSQSNNTTSSPTNKKGSPKKKSSPPVKDENPPSKVTPKIELLDDLD